MTHPRLSRKTIFLLIALTTLIIGGFPTSTLCTYESENCEMGCRIAFDPVLNATEYATCVEQCKRYLSGRPQL
jgi:hypothetical protein